jgi:site-specific recombinase XerD
MIKTKGKYLFKFTLRSNPKTNKNHFKREVRNVQRCLKRIAKEAKIKKNIYPHLFRHSYGTWLARNGTII